MAARVGKIFVELSLDDKPYKQLLSDNLKTTETTARGIETSWKALGQKNDATYDAMRRSYENALTLIKNSTTSTAQDIIRAEQAKNEKIIALNEQQFGHQKSGLEILKGHYMAFSVAAVAAIGTITKGWNMAKVGAGFEEQEAMLGKLSTKYGTTADTIVSEMDRAAGYQVAKSELMSIALAGIAKGLNPDQLINLANAAETLGDAVGKDATVALRDLTEALETGRTKGLKTYLGTSLDLETAFGDLTGKLTATESATALFSSSSRLNT